MRFTRGKTLRDAYNNGTSSIKTKYLWFPVTIDGETRWLEEATIEYRVKKEKGVIFDDYYYWFPWYFVNK